MHLHKCEHAHTHACASHAHAQAHEIKRKSTVINEAEAESIWTEDHLRGAEEDTTPLSGLTHDFLPLLPTQLPKTLLLFSHTELRVSPDLPPGSILKLSSY